MVFTACEKEIIPSIEFENATIDAGFEADSYVVPVSSNISWTIVNENDWIAVEEDSDNTGSKALILEVMRNEEMSPREGIITLANSTYGYSSELKVIQRAFVPEIKCKDRIGFIVEGGEQIFEVVANMDYQTSVDADWVTIEPNKIGFIVTVPPYFETTERTATITLSNARYNYTKEIEVNQSPFIPAMVIVPSTLNFTFEGGTQEITITSNYSYEVSDDADWLSVEKSNEGAIITALSCDTKSGRSATVTISSEKYAISKEVVVSQDALNENAPNVIIYTTTDNNVINIQNTIFGTYLISNRYVENHGVIIFDRPDIAILDSAFRACANLKEITLPEGVKSIGDSAFRDCPELINVVIPSTMESIGCYVFSSANKLASINLPNSIKEIGYGAFASCSALTAFNIPNGVTKIDDSTFHDCDKLAEITIPESVTKIGNWVFYGCNALSTVKLPNNIQEIGESAFYQCRNLSSISIPEGITVISKQMFYGCSNLATIVLPTTLLSIGEEAFRDCGISEIVIPEKVTTIANSAFSACLNLTSITLPQSITSVGNSAFYNCKRLKDVYCKPTTPPAGGANMFDNTANERKIYVPQASVETYKANANWSTYAAAILGYEF